MSTELSILLFGPPRVECGGAAIRFARRKALALLAYLAATEGVHSRDTLATLLWPDLDQHHARAMVRHVLLTLHQCLGPTSIRTEGDRVTLAAEPGLVVDTRRFGTLLTQVSSHDHTGRMLCTSCRDALVEAVELYQDAFLAGFSLPAADEYERWQNRHAEQLQHEMAWALERLVLVHAQEGEHGRPQATEFARRWVALDPTNEPAQRALMSLYAASGERAAALHQFQQCERLLAEELGVEPDAVTLAWAGAIRAGETPLLYDAPFAAPVNDTSVLVSTPAFPAHNLPPQVHEFVGREREIGEVQRALHNPDCRLLTLTGHGGIGKTRLVLEAARRQVEETPCSFGDGIWIVDLAPISNPDNLIMAVLRAMHRPLGEPDSAQQQLADYLAGRSMLLVLDNFEHLAEGKSLLEYWLQTARGLKILVTSRVRLNLLEETVLVVRGLGLDSTSAPGVLADDDYRSDAVRLFVSCTSRTLPQTLFTPADIVVIERICRLLDGIPLAIELAAAWLRMMSLDELERELAEGIDLLTAAQHDVSPRHRSMRAVFDVSWTQLSPREQAILCSLTACRGCTHSAAAAIAGANLNDILGLLDKSWLHVTGAPGGKLAQSRFSMHEVCRKYCSERLADQAAGASAEGEQAMKGLDSAGAPARHSAYYAQFLADKERHMYRRPEVIAEIEAELPNLHVAWQWSLAHADTTNLSRMLLGLAFLAELRGEASLVISLLETAVLRMRRVPNGANSDAENSRHPLLARTLYLLALLACHLGRLAKAEEYLGGGFEELEQDKNNASPERRQEDRMLLRRAQALVHSSYGDWQAARDIYDELLAAVEAARVPLWPYQGDVGISFWLAQFRYLRGTAFWGLGDIVQARAEFRQALAHCDSIGEQRFKAHILDLLAYIHLEQGATAEALEIANEALRMSNACGDHLWVSHLQVILGRIALAQGRRNKAHKHGLAALQFARASGELFILQEALHLLGDVELVRKNLDEAERRYAESMTAIEARGIDRYFLQAAGLVGLGNVALARGDFSLAEQHFEHALARAGSVAWDEAYALHGLAQVYARQNRWTVAALYAERVIEFGASPARIRAACARLLRGQ